MATTEHGSKINSNKFTNPQQCYANTAQRKHYKVWTAIDNFRVHPMYVYSNLNNVAVLFQA